MKLPVNDAIDDCRLEL